MNGTVIQKQGTTIFLYENQTIADKLRVLDYYLDSYIRDRGYMQAAQLTREVEDYNKIIAEQELKTSILKEMQSKNQAKLNNNQKK